MRKGSHHKPETIEKMIIKLKGRHISPITEFKKGMISLMKGKHHTEESKEKNRQSHLGRKLTPIWIEKIRLSHLGKPSGMKGKKLTEQQKNSEIFLKKYKVLSEKLRGLKRSEEAKLRIKQGRAKQIITEEHKMNISLALKGKPKPKGFSEHLIKEKNPNWQGGKSFEPYTSNFNKKLKEQIRKRDNYRCQECFRHQDELFTKGKDGKMIKYKLHIHHIDYNKKNTNPDNLISLCLNCHQQTNYNRNNWTNYLRGKINGI